MLRIGEVVAAQENKGDKMQLLYDYLTGNEFRQRIEAISEAFSQMSHVFSERACTSPREFREAGEADFQGDGEYRGLYGEVRGIAGGAVQVVDALEAEDDSATGAPSVIVLSQFPSWR